MDKKRLRVALKVLESGKTKYLETKQFIEILINEGCQKEKTSADEVIFLPVQKETVGSEKHFLF